MRKRNADNKRTPRKDKKIQDGGEAVSAGTCEMCELDGISGNTYGTKLYFMGGLRYVLCDRCAALFGLMSHPAIANMRTMTGELMFDVPAERIEEVSEDK